MYSISTVFLLLFLDQCSLEGVGGGGFSNEVVMLAEGSVGRNMLELSPEQRTTTGIFHHINRNQEERGFCFILISLICAGQRMTRRALK